MPIDALSVLYAQLTRDLFVIAKFLFLLVELDGRTTAKLNVTVKSPRLDVSLRPVYTQRAANSSIRHVIEYRPTFNYLRRVAAKTKTYISRARTTAGSELNRCRVACSDKIISRFTGSRAQHAPDVRTRSNHNNCRYQSASDQQGRPSSSSSSISSCCCCNAV